MAYDFTPFTKQITETKDWLTREFTTVRTGRATASILDNVKVDSYGSMTPISQVGSITIEDARSLRVIPWDKSLIKEIEGAITKSDLGVGVGSDDQGVRVSFPELTSERRTMLMKVAKDKLEQARVTLRGHRGDTIKDIEVAEKGGGMGQDDVKRYKEEVQKMVDKTNEELDGMLKKKEAEIAL
jgi:ribosome recycling factor